MKSEQPDSNLTSLRKKFRNSVVKDITASTSNYIKNYFLCNSNNINKFWSGIKSVINISKVKADYIPTLLEGDKSIDNPCAIANILNNFFVNVGRNTDKDISQGNCSPTSFLNGNFPESMFLSPITPFKVEPYIFQTDNNKSIDPCSIPVPR